MQELDAQVGDFLVVLFLGNLQPNSTASNMAATSGRMMIQLYPVRTGSDTPPSG